MGSGAPLDRKWKFRLCYNIFVPFSRTYSAKQFSSSCVQGDPATGQPFTPRRFFRKLEATAFLNPSSENSEKNTAGGDRCSAQDSLSLVVVCSNRSCDIRWWIFGEFPDFLKIGDNDFPQNLIECMGVGLRRNLEVWTILLKPFFVKIDVHILPPGSTV